MSENHEIPSVMLASGILMPLVGFGTWQLRGNQAYQAVRTALDCGYRHIDTATIYRNEKEAGRAIRDSGVHRNDIFYHHQAPRRRGRAGAGHSRRQPARPGHRSRRPVAGALAAGRVGEPGGMA